MSYMQRLNEEQLRIGFEEWWADIAPRLRVPKSGAGSVDTMIAWFRIKDLARRLISSKSDTTPMPGVEG